MSKGHSGARGTSVAKLLVSEDCPHREGHSRPVRPHFPGASELGQKARVLGVQQLYCLQAPVKRFFNLLFLLQAYEDSKNTLSLTLYVVDWSHVIPDAVQFIWGAGAYLELLVLTKCQASDVPDSLSVLKASLYGSHSMEHAGSTALHICVPTAGLSTAQWQHIASIPAPAILLDNFRPWCPPLICFAT